MRLRSAAGSKRQEGEQNMKEVFIYAGGVVLAVLLVCVIGRLMARKKHIVLSSVSGVAALVVINLTAGITGVGLGYTLLSIGTSVLLGLPGVALLLLGHLL